MIYLCIAYGVSSNGFSYKDGKTEQIKFRFSSKNIVLVDMLVNLQARTLEFTYEKDYFSMDLPQVVISKSLFKKKETNKHWVPYVILSDIQDCVTALKITPSKFGKK